MYRVSHDCWQYKRYKHHFLNSWTHEDKSADVKEVYLANESDLDRSHRGSRFNKYLDQNGQECDEWFHGTQRACYVGEAGSYLTYCYNPECYLCSILRYSFDVRHASDSAMFGRGIYTSPCSSKSDTYAKNHHIRSHKHAILICRVVSNAPREMTAADHSLSSPGHGYDSVRGLTVSEGGSLNYPEVVVYRNDAIIPIGVIIYTREGWS
ncbi:hypothetical protein F5Y14DRAFT_392265 [Nemania sp. NC0429]|nr:hypothetical protein F5Y14DRAFT_392265 [Nemania sp. NC0429]